VPGEGEGAVVVTVVVAVKVVEYAGSEHGRNAQPLSCEYLFLLFH
jgi:hypothetical protein